MEQIQDLRIDQIRRDSGAQFRPELSEAHVENLREAIERGDTLPPIVVFFDGEVHWMADGDHRIEAKLRAGQSTVASDVRPGTREDAVFYGTGANADHGLPRSSKTKRALVTWLLKERQSLGISGIAKHAKVSRPFVYQVINDDPELKLSCKRLQDSEPRIAVRGGKEYEMRTGNIGAHLNKKPPAYDEAGAWEADDLEDGDEQAESSKSRREIPKDAFGCGVGDPVTDPIAAAILAEDYPLSILAQCGVQLDDKTEWHGLSGPDSGGFMKVEIKPQGMGCYQVRVGDFDVYHSSAPAVHSDWLVWNINKLGATPEQLVAMRWTNASEPMSPERTAALKESLEKFVTGTIEVGTSWREVKALLDQDKFARWLEAEFQATPEKAELFIAVANAADAGTPHDDLIEMAGDAWFSKGTGLAAA